MSQAPITIRTATPGDLPAVEALNSQAVPAVNAVPLSQLNWFAQQGDFWVATVTHSNTHSMTGFLVCLPPGVNYPSLNYQWFSERYQEFLYVDRIVVDPPWQGHGIGRQLYETLFAEAIGRQVGRVLCEVNLRPRNDRSLDFHRRLGFEPVGRQDTEGGTKTVEMMCKTFPEILANQVH